MGSIAVYRSKNARTNINLLRGLVEDVREFVLKCVDECVIISGCSGHGWLMLVVCVLGFRQWKCIYGVPSPGEPKGRGAMEIKF